MMPYRRTLLVTFSDFCSRRSAPLSSAKMLLSLKAVKDLVWLFLEEFLLVPESFAVSHQRGAAAAWFLLALGAAAANVRLGEGWIPCPLSSGCAGDELSDRKPEAGTCQPRSFFHSIISPCDVALPYPATRCLMDNTSDKGKTSSMHAEGNFRGCWLLPSCSEIPALDGVWEEIRPWCCEFPSALATLQQHT